MLILSGVAWVIFTQKKTIGHYNVAMVLPFLCNRDKNPS